MRTPTDAVAITGVGILTPLADSLPALGAALRAGRTALCDVGGHAMATLTEFDPIRYASVRGMRLYPRAAQLQICAATRALEDAALDVDPEQLGVISASTYAHLDTLISYDRSLVTLGVERTNPTLMPLALPSAAGALTALALGAKAFAITLSDGGASGLAALAIAAHKLRSERARACVVVASFAQSAELARAAERAGWLATRQQVRPFDRDSHGCGLGELAVAFTLEPTAYAARRGRAPLALFSAHASSFSLGPEQIHTTLEGVCRHALSRDGGRALGLVSAGSNGQPVMDRSEACALGALLAEQAEVPVTAVKSQLGESFDASSLLQVAISIDALQVGSAPPIAGLSTPIDTRLALARDVVAVPAPRALITSVSPSGSCSALVLKGTA